MTPKELIGQGRTALGIEFGSTRIKGVLVDYDGNVLAVGEHVWENHLENGIWTYPLSEVDAGLRSCYSALRNDVKEKYGIVPETFGAIGVSAMMHGYIALDKDDNQLAPFQTWRNTNTTEAADELTELLQFNIPLRWSAAHLYQRLLDGEAHVKNVASVFTLAAYVHYKLTGEKVIGIGDAAGMFPIDSDALDYDQRMVEQFDGLLAQFMPNGSLTPGRQGRQRETKDALFVDAAIHQSKCADGAVGGDTRDEQTHKRRAAQDGRSGLVCEFLAEGLYLRRGLQINVDALHVGIIQPAEIMSKTGQNRHTGKREIEEGGVCHSGRIADRLRSLVSTGIFFEHGGTLVHGTEHTPLLHFNVLFAIIQDKHTHGIEPVSQCGKTFEQHALACARTVVARPVLHFGTPRLDDVATAEHFHVTSRTHALDNLVGGMQFVVVSSTARPVKDFLATDSGQCVENGAHYGGVAVEVCLLVAHLRLGRHGSRLFGHDACYVIQRRDAEHLPTLCKRPVRSHCLIEAFACPVAAFLPAEIGNAGGTPAPDARTFRSRIMIVVAQVVVYPDGTGLNLSVEPGHLTHVFKKCRLTGTVAELVFHTRGTRPTRPRLGSPSVGIQHRIAVADSHLHLNRSAYANLAQVVLRTCQLFYVLAVDIQRRRTYAC